MTGMYWYVPLREASDFSCQMIGTNKRCQAATSFLVLLACHPLSVCRTRSALSFVGRHGAPFFLLSTEELLLGNAKMLPSRGH